MKNSLGNNLILSIFGESHGEYIGGVLDGLTPGIRIDEEYIRKLLSKRRPSSLDTPRVEQDNFKIVSGVFNGYTTGAPLCILIENDNVKSGDYQKDLPRPSHSDYPAFVRYNGFNDYRGGGHFSGRLTAVIVALGAICLKELESKRIFIGTHIKRCGDFIDQDFSDYKKDFDAINKKNNPIIDENEVKLINIIKNVKEQGDSIGGVTETAIVGLPVGLGEPWFSSLEGELSNAMFAIGGVKGIEFGLGFGFVEGLGSQLNDQLFVDENNEIKTKTNNNGGINGGLTNGMPVIFKLAIKPTPSVAKKQNTVNLSSLENEELLIHGRHDPAIVRRVPIVATCLSAIVIFDLLIGRYGADYFKK